jgi:dUTP pyrophosphatase
LDTIKVCRLIPQAHLPTRKHPQDAGIDFYAAVDVTIPPYATGIVPTGISIEIPSGMVGLLKPKGRSNHLLGAGVVDAGYQGEILIKVVNPSDQPLHFSPGEAVGQMLLLPVFTPEIEEVSQEELHHKTSPRGGSGGIVDQHTSHKG